MSTPPKKPDVRLNPLLLDDDEFRIARQPAKPPADADRVEPRVMPDWVNEAAQSTAPTRVSAAEEPPAPPRWPMFDGTFTFPFYFCTLGVWMLISLGLMVTGWLAMLWIAYGDVMGMTSARLFGLPTLAAGTLTLAYAASCCLSIIEDTSYGYDVLEIAPEMDWKGWIWDLWHIVALGLQAGMVGAAVQFVSSSHSWLPAVAGTFAAFPFVVLGALAAEGAWVPTAILSVLRSLAHVWWAWGLFFLETAAMAVGWTFVTRAGLQSESPWLTPLYAAPLLGAVILIYARLLGRLAGCIAKATEESSTEGDHDDES
jgi:hypothetical protein